MKIIEPGFKILHMANRREIYQTIEKAARLCYKSEEKITPDSAEPLIRRLIKSGHESVIEHMSIVVLFTCDRGISHELVRHRLCSFSQESTRYASYNKVKFGKEITVIRPIFWPTSHPLYMPWKNSCLAAERAYMRLLDNGAKAQEARSVLPNSLKTEIVTTANLREWRHILTLRCGKAAHPQIRQIMLPLLDTLHQVIPVFFESIYKKHEEEIKSL